MKLLLTFLFTGLFPILSSAREIQPKQLINRTCKKLQAAAVLDLGVIQQEDIIRNLRQINQKVSVALQSEKQRIQSLSLEIQQLQTELDNYRQQERERNNTRRQQRKIRNCRQNIRENVPWDYYGNNYEWSNDNLQQMCGNPRSYTNAEEPGNCFNQVMDYKIQPHQLPFRQSFGKGSSMNWKLAIQLCSSGLDTPTEMFSCFDRAVRGDRRRTRNSARVFENAVNSCTSVH